eukprot:EG_transcript_3867
MALPSGLNVPSLFQPSRTSIPVIDPKLKQFGRLWISMHRVEHTKAVERWISADPRQSSLCLLYSKGECNAGDKCNQLHVERAYTQAIRDYLTPLEISNCCFGHGDIASIRPDFQNLLRLHPLELVTDVGKCISVPSNCLAVTTFWDQHLCDQNIPSGPLRINVGRVCRLHQRELCKFGTDCNNLHICRKLWATIPELNQNVATPSTLQPITIKQQEAHIPVKVISPKKEEAQSVQRKASVPPMQLEAIEPISPFCSMPRLSPSFQIPSPEKSPHLTPLNAPLGTMFQAMVPVIKNPPLAAARTINPPPPFKPPTPKASSKKVAQPSPQEPAALLPFWYASIPPPRGTADQVPAISPKLELQIQPSPQFPAAQDPITIPNHSPISTEKYLSFLMYTKTDGKAINQAGSDPDTLLNDMVGIQRDEMDFLLDQKTVLEKLPLSLLQALDFNLGPGY